MNRFPDTCPYAVLGLDRRCSQDDIKAAYKKQALKSHPDRAPAELKEHATAQFKIIGEAYEILSDPKRRREYDFFSPSPDPAGMGSFNPFAAPFSNGDAMDYDDEHIDTSRKHFGTSPDGQSFSFTWESSADSARRAQQGRRFGRPFGADGFDPFELFNMTPPSRPPPPPPPTSSAAAAPGMGATSESRSTRIINGRQETTIRKVDMQGNETVHRITPEGQTVHVNGVQQHDHPLLSGSGAQPMPIQTAGTRQNPIDVDADSSHQYRNSNGSTWNWF